MKRSLALLFGAFTALMAPPGAKADPLLLAGGCQSQASVQFILRQDFTDIPTLGCGDSSTEQLQLATGTRASYTYDDIHKASSFSVDGLAAMNIRYTVPGIDNYVSRFSFGPYAQGAGTRSLATATTPASTSGSVTTGAFLQFYQNTVLPTKFRLRGGELTDSTAVRDGTAVGELIPAFRLEQLEKLLGIKFLPDQIGYFIFGAEYPVSYLVGEGSPASNLKLVFAPEVEAQYDSYQAGPLSYALFSAHHEAMRVGPLLVGKLYGFEEFAQSGTVLRTALQRLIVSASYHADWDVLSARRYYSFQPALIYNLDETGNYALTTSYSIGNSETSGNKARQVKVAFAAKF